MTKHLLLLSLLSCGLTAQAAKVDYHINTEFRVRGQYNHQPDGVTSPASTDAFESRVKLGGGAKVNERFGFHGALLHNSGWGSENQSITAGTGNTGFDQPNGINNYDNMVLVQEAYGTWILNESLSMRFGRSAIFFGDELVMGQNDYLRTPSSFDGAVLNYELSSLRLMGFAARLAHYTTATSGASDPDAQANAIGVVADMKRLPPYLKMANIHIIRNTKAATPTAALSKDKMGENGYRYGASVGGDVKAFDYRVSYAGLSTDYKYQAAANGPITKFNGNGWMLDLEGGFRLAVMDSRVFARYHIDSGDGSTNTAGITGATTYNPYFYEQHGNAGQMDILRWGNLTYYGLGFTMKPMDQLTVGVEAYMFKKTQQRDFAYAGFNGTNLLATGTQTVMNSNNIGSEIDVYAEKAYDGGFSVIARLGHFMVGDYLKDNGRTKNITQAFLQGKMNF